MKPLEKINDNAESPPPIKPFEHKEAEDDDCGLPENPIFSNYSKYLWKSHTENPRMQKNLKLLRDKDGNKKLE